MRRRNIRVVMVGAVLLLLAACFFLFMLTLAAKSNDPAEMMRTVGMASGAVGGLAIVMIIAGLIGKKA